MLLGLMRGMFPYMSLLLFDDIRVPQNVPKWYNKIMYNSWFHIPINFNRFSGQCFLELY